MSTNKRCDGGLRPFVAFPLPPKDAPDLRGGQVETTSLCAVFMYIELVVGALTEATNV